MVRTSEATILPFSDFAGCLVSKISRDELGRKIPVLADQVQNDALLTLAVRSWLDGDTKAAKTYLRECPRVSTPNSEWPSPYAKISILEVVLKAMVYFRKNSLRPARRSGMVFLAVVADSDDGQ